MNYGSCLFKSGVINSQCICHCHINDVLNRTLHRSGSMHSQASICNSDQLIPDVCRNVDSDSLLQTFIIEYLAAVIQDFYSVFCWIADNVSGFIGNVSIYQIRQKSLCYAFRSLQLRYDCISSAFQAFRRVCFDAYQVFPVCKAPSRRINKNWSSRSCRSSLIVSCSLL